MATVAMVAAVATEDPDIAENIPQLRNLSVHVYSSLEDIAQETGFGTNICHLSDTLNIRGFG